MKYIPIEFIQGVYSFINREYLSQLYTIDFHMELLNNGISIEGYSISFRLSFKDISQVNKELLNAYFQSVETKNRDLEYPSKFTYYYKIIGNYLIIQTYLS